MANGESNIEVGRVEFVLVWVPYEDDPGMYTHKYEVTLGHFEDRTEIIRMGETLRHQAGNDGKIPRLSSEWMKVHAILSSRGFLKGR